MAKFGTKQIHGDIENRRRSGETTSGPVQSSSFEHETAQNIQNVFAQREFGFLYTRIANPTIAKLEERLRILEGGIGAVATSSGMAAVSLALLNVLQSGDEFVCGNSLFGGCFTLFNEVFPRFGIKPVFVEASNPQAYEAAITSKTKAVFFEVIGNPKIDVPSIKAISEIAHAHGLPVILDNTVATPWMFSAKDFGADIIVHSTSKYVNGSGNSIGGVVIDCGTFKFEGEKFADFEPFSKKFRELAYIAKLRKQLFINLGPCQSPQNAFLQLAGLETLSLRMPVHCNNALAVAQLLEAHPKVQKVNYAGLTSSPFHETAKQQFGEHFGGLLSFEVANKDAAFDFINRRGFSRNLSNIGDAKTLVLHPDSTIYHDYSPENKTLVGVNERMIRVSVGLEDVEDLMVEFETALG